MKRIFTDTDHVTIPTRVLRLVSARTLAPQKTSSVSFTVPAATARVT